MSILDDLVSSITNAAGNLGVDPIDLATAISYETGGTFDPNAEGPTTKWGQHRGLLQWGEPQAEQYLSGDFSVPSQLEGAEDYLRDAGVTPGMGLLDIYSAINAGQVGRYGASDEAAGGAPGTVSDKVQNQMAGHREKAADLLGGEATIPTTTTMQGFDATAGAGQDRPDAPPAVMDLMRGGEEQEAGGNPLLSAMRGMGGQSRQPRQQASRPMQPMQQGQGQFPSLSDYLEQFLSTR